MERDISEALDNLYKEIAKESSFNASVLHECGLIDAKPDQDIDKAIFLIGLACDELFVLQDKDEYPGYILNRTIAHLEESMKHIDDDWKKKKLVSVIDCIKNNKIISALNLSRTIYDEIEKGRWH